MEAKIFAVIRRVTIPVTGLMAPGTNPSNMDVPSKRAATTMTVLSFFSALNRGYKVDQILSPLRGSQNKTRKKNRTNNYLLDRFH